MLYLVGLGIYDERDLSLKGLDALRKCRRIFAEFYTSPAGVNLKKLEALVGKKVEVLGREQVEEEEVILDSAEKEDTAFLVPGDSLSATTHIDVVLNARKRGIAVDCVHSSSIFTAVAETGLQLYKFGKTVSLPLPQEGYFPDSPYAGVRDNLLQGLHTLLLLDIGMKANKAIELLLELEKKMDKNVFTPDSRIVVCAHLGSGSLIKYGKIRELMKMDFGGVPHTIVVPGKLHFHEEEFVCQFK